MMDRLEDRGRAIGVRAADAAVLRVAAAARAALPGLDVQAEEDRVTISGRGIGRQLLGDPALRWVAGWLK